MPARIDGLLRLSEVDGPRKVAALLAERFTPADLAPVFAGGGPVGASEELRACLVHEMVLREMPVDFRWAASPHWRYHPLGRLPRRLTTVEAAGIRSRGLPPPGHATHLRKPPGPPDGTETTTPALAEAIGGPAATWVNGSNGQREARTYAIGGPLDDVAATLARLEPDCLAGGGIALTPATPAEIWQSLFRAAARGGAYTEGEFGAYGRLTAWRAMTAMAGVDDLDDVAACSWYGFTASTPWFEDLMWDVGVVAISPDRRRLALFAATDSD